MVEKLSPTAKVSISAFSVLVVMVSVFVTAVYMRDVLSPFMDTGTGVSGEVAGVTTARSTSGNASVPTSDATISLVDEGGGTASLYLNLDSFARVTGLDLFFSVSGELSVEGVTCEEDFECVSTVAGDKSLRIIVFRPPNIAGELWSGTAKVATIAYTPGASAVLEMNGDTSRVSEVIEMATGRNLLENRTVSFSIGE